MRAALARALAIVVVPRLVAALVPAARRLLRVALVRVPALAGIGAGVLPRIVPALAGILARVLSRIAPALPGILSRIGRATPRIVPTRVLPGIRPASAAPALPLVRRRRSGGHEQRDDEDREDPQNSAHPWADRPFW